MNDLGTTALRISEWSRIADCGLPRESRARVAAAVEAWRICNRLPSSPLTFGGPEGSDLLARQYVGVVEVDDVAVEIYPKLDAELLTASEQRPLAPEARVDSVMQNLLWMLHVSSFREMAETETAHLEEAPTSFVDLFAYLLGKNLLPELERGVLHSYIAMEDDLRMVRGRIDLRRQATRNWDRFDRLACAWDEFTADTPINRLFKCACRFLSERVRYGEAARLLVDCVSLLSEVQDAPPTQALRDVSGMRFHRGSERFRTVFDLAKRLLAGTGHNLGVGSANTFVFLLDMNDVFEKYAHAVLEAHFQTRVEQQKYLGQLFELSPGGLCQYADYYWQDHACVWIGDAKYKHLARGQLRPLRFSDFDSEDGEEVGPLAGKVIGAADVRQLTVYAELARGTGEPPNLALLYPFVGLASECRADSCSAWNGSRFLLVPVQVRAQAILGNAIQIPVA